MPQVFGRITKHQIYTSFPNVPVHNFSQKLDWYARSRKILKCQPTDMQQINYDYSDLTATVLCEYVNNIYSFLQFRMINVSPLKVVSTYQ